MFLYKFCIKKTWLFGTGCGYISEILYGVY